MKISFLQNIRTKFESSLQPSTFINIAYTLFVMFALYFIGTFISSLISSLIIIPGNIIGMLLLFLFLELKIVSYKRIKKTGNFLLKHLSLFFIPFGVSILKYYKLLDGKSIQFFLILLISTAAAFSCSAIVLNKLTGGDQS